MKKLIYIDHEPYTKRRCQVFRHKELMEAGVEIEVWSLSKFYFGDVQYADQIETPYLRKVSTIEELKRLINGTDISNTIFEFEYWDLWKSRRIFRVMSDYGCYFIRINLYANTMVVKHREDRWKRAFSSDIVRIVKRRAKKWAFPLYCKIHNIRDFDRVFSSSSITYRTDFINHPDYEDFMWGEHTPIIKGDYILFIDQYFPYHPDLIRAYPKKKLSGGDAYHKTMNAYFNFLEHKYHMPVVIAAHPKAEYTGDEFGGREIIKYHTDTLVFYSELVVCHFSNSVSYLVLQEKPMAFVTTDGMDDIPSIRSTCNTVASFLNKKVYNLDKMSFEEIEISPINSERCNLYKYSFLTSKETENRKNVDILLDLLTNNQ